MKGSRPVRFLAACGIVLWLCALVGAQNTDPPSIQRTRLRPDQVPEALGKVEEGVLQRMPIDKFDELVRSASEKQRPPVLLETRYRAQVQIDPGNELSLVGTGEWKIRRRQLEDAILPVAGMQIAVKSAKWEDGSDAMLYVPNPGGALALYIPDEKKQLLKLGWSSRGLAEPGGEAKFDLRLPSAAIATLDLEVPAGFLPVLTQANALMTGPTPLAGGSSLWKISFTGMDRIEIVLRRTVGDRVSLFYKLDASYTLNELEGRARHEFQIESAKGGVSEFEFEYESGLILRNVDANNLLTWNITTVGKSQRLHVFLKEPTRTLTVVTTSSFDLRWDPNTWSPPSIKPLNSVIRGDNLHITFPPGISILDWQGRHYRLKRTETTNDRSFILHLLPTISEGPDFNQLPRFWLRKKPGIDWQATQDSTWKIGREFEEWTVSSSVTVHAGSLAEISFRVPEGWKIVEASWGGKTTEWRQDPNLVVIAPQSLLRGETANLQVRLRKPVSDSLTRKFPDLTPLGASYRAGKLTIQGDPGILLFNPNEPIKSLTSTSSTLFEIPFQNEGPQGHILAEALGSTYDVRCDTVVHERLGSMSSRLSVRALGKIPDQLAIRTEAPIATPWLWRDQEGKLRGEAVRRPDLEAVPWLLGISGPNSLMSTAVFQTADQSGYQWRLPLVRSEEMVLTSDYQVDSRSYPIRVLLTGQGGLSNWALLGSLNTLTPLSDERVVTPWISSDHFEGTISLSLSDVDILANDPRFQRLPSREESQSRFRYGIHAGAVPTKGLTQAIQAEYESAILVSRLTEEKGIACEFSFLVRGEKRVIVQLPPEATFDRARLAESVVGAQVDKERVVVVLADSMDWSHVRISYHLPVSRNFFVCRVLSPQPFLVNNSVPVRRVWMVPSHWKPLETTNLFFHPQSTWTNASLPLPDPRRFSDWWRSTDNESSSPGDRRLSTAELLKLLEDGYPHRTIILDRQKLQRSDLLHYSGPVTTESYLKHLQSCGIVFVEYDKGIVLTTADERRHWEADLPQFTWTKLSPTIAAALDQAVRFGRDASGRFEQLQLLPTQSLPSDLFPSNWATFEEQQSSTRLTLIYLPVAVSSLWLISLLLIALPILLWGNHRGPRFMLYATMLIVLLGWYGGDPYWKDCWAPPLFVSLVTAIWLVYRNFNPTRQTPSRWGILPLLVVLLVTGWATWSRGADSSDEVFLLSDDKTVLVSPKLIDRLNTFALQRRLPPRLALLSANYRGELFSTHSTWEAEFKVATFEDQATLHLPLLGARYREVKLDGKDAEDISSEADGLRLRIPKKGDHLIKLSFSLTQSQNTAELRLSIPEAPLTTATIQAKQAGVRLRSSNWRGRSMANADGNQLTIDLGISSAIHLGWSTSTDVPSEPPRVRSAVLAKIAPDQVQVFQSLEYRQQAGALSEVTLSLPLGVQVYRVDLLGEVLSRTSPAIGIRDWRLLSVPGQPNQLLQVSFRSPVSGRFRLDLEMFQRFTGSRFKLEWLHPQQASLTESLIAFQTEGDIEATFEPNGIEEIDPATQQRAAWIGIGPMLGTGPGWKMYHSLRPTAGSVGVSLKLSSSIRSVAETLDWVLDSESLRVQSSARWIGSKDGLSFLEWQLPGSIVISNVTGANLHSWSQRGEKLMVWLSQSQTEASLLWNGSMKSPPSSVTISTADHPHVGLQTTSLSFQTRGGWIAVPLDDRELSPQGATGIFRWQENQKAQDRFQIFPPQENGVQVEPMQLSLKGDQILAETSINFKGLLADRPHMLLVSVATPDGGTASLSIPETWETDIDADRKTWLIRVPAGRKGIDELPLSLLSAKGKSRWAIPQVRIWPGGNQLPLATSSVLIKDSRLRIRKERSRTLSAINDLGMVERVTGEPGNQVDEANILAQPRGSDWLMRGRWRVLPEENESLVLTFSPECQIRQARIDGIPVEVYRQILVIPAGEERSLEVTWTVPNWSRKIPSLTTQATDRPIRHDADWTVLLPPETHLVQSSSVPVEARLQRDSTLAELILRSVGLPIQFTVPSEEDLHLQYEEESGRTLPPSGTAAILIALLLVVLLCVSFMTHLPEHLFLLGIAGFLSFGLAGLLFLVPSFYALWMRGREAFRYRYPPSDSP
jgi:hypothetical protein